MSQRWFTARPAQHHRRSKDDQDDDDDNDEDQDEEVEDGEVGEDESAAAKPPGAHAGLAVPLRASASRER